jgi:hypothetical protein
VQRQQLLTESEIFKDEIFPRTNGANDPSQEVSERRDDGQNHGENLTELRPIGVVSKSFILRVHEVLMRDRYRLSLFRSYVNTRIDPKTKN